MILLHRRRTAVSDTETAPLRSHEQPREDAAPQSEPGSSLLAAPGSRERTWTCARCGAVSHSARRAMEHINLHSFQKR